MMSMVADNCCLMNQNKRWNFICPMKLITLEQKAMGKISAFQTQSFTFLQEVPQVCQAAVSSSRVIYLAFTILLLKIVNFSGPYFIISILFVVSTDLCIILC